MKRCIWCSKDESQETFMKLAHTFPQSLGGKNICENVCDRCNKFFGDKESQFPSVEIALKEVLNLSKYLLLHKTNEKLKVRFKSEYFDYRPNSHSLKLKMKYQLRRNFQLEFGRRFRRGVYKVFLEERERQKKDAHDDRFNFIRSFARYDFDDYPVYYLKPKFKALVFSLPDIKNPEIRFTEHSDNIDKNYRFYSYAFLGHNLVIPTINQFLDERLRYYKDFLIKDDSPFGNELIEINYIEDLDFRFQFMTDKQ